MKPEDSPLKFSNPTAARDWLVEVKSFEEVQQFPGCYRAVKLPKKEHTQRFLWALRELYDNTDSEDPETRVQLLISPVSGEQYFRVGPEPEKPSEPPRRRRRTVRRGFRPRRS